MAAWLYFFYSLVFCLLLGIAYALLKVFFINGVPCSSRERLDGKTVIITGGNGGIGKETTVDLAQRGARVILACRDLSTGSSAVREIKERSGSENIVLKRLDLASCKSVRDFASQILQEEDQVNILICNAGLMFPPFQLTEDGFELTFGVNHLGHFLLTNLLLERIKESTPSRIIVVSSLAHVTGYLDFDDMMWRKRYNPYLAYCRSKLANVMFARELARRLSDTPGLTVCALHPGTVNTELYRYFLSGWMALVRVSMSVCVCMCMCVCVCVCSHTHSAHVCA